MHVYDVYCIVYVYIHVMYYGIPALILAITMSLCTHSIPSIYTYTYYEIIQLLRVKVMIYKI